MSILENLKAMNLKKVPSGGFERAFERYQVEVPLRAQILIPEETFQPKDYIGNTLDVSRAGMRIRLADFELLFYTKLLMRPRYIRVKLDNPVGDFEIKITGRIVSIDYHKKNTADKSGDCNLGVFFDKNEGVDLASYVKFIEAIETHCTD